MWEAAGAISPQAAGRVEPEQQGWLQLSAPWCLISAPRLGRHISWRPVMDIRMKTITRALVGLTGSSAVGVLVGPEPYTSEGGSGSAACNKLGMSPANICKPLSSEGGQSS